MELYTDLIIDLNKHPLNKRSIPNADITHSGANVTCGDRVRLYIKTDKDGIVQDCSFEGEGCAISMAAASLVTEETKGKSLTEVTGWNALTIFEWLGTELGANRIKCGLLALETLQAGIAQNSSLQKAA